MPCDLYQLDCFVPVVVCGCKGETLKHLKESREELRVKYWLSSIAHSSYVGPCCGHSFPGDRRVTCLKVSCTNIALDGGSVSVAPNGHTVDLSWPLQIYSQSAAIFSFFSAGLLNVHELTWPWVLRSHVPPSSYELFNYKSPSKPSQDSSKEKEVQPVRWFKGKAKKLCLQSTVACRLQTQCETGYQYIFRVANERLQWTSAKPQSCHGMAQHSTQLSDRLFFSLP